MRTVPWLCRSLLCGMAMALANCLPLLDADDKMITQYDVERAPWPQVGGPYGNCSAPAYGLSLIEDLSQARLIWKSQQIVPSSSPMVGKKQGVGGTFGGEYGTPIAADGNIYLAYWRMTGRDNWLVTEADLKHWVKSGRNPVQDLPASVTADDILLCVDAATGKTVWENILGTGRPIAGYKSGAHMACAWWDGKVIFAGCNSAYYCVDGKTGEAIWKTSGRSKGSGRDTHFATPLVSGGVVVIESRAFDVASGKQLWKMPRGIRAATDFGTPWLHKGVAYFLFNKGLVEAKTGKLCWEFDHPGGGPGPVVYGDLAVLGRRGPTARHRGDGSDPKDWPKNSMGIFKISPAGYELLWSAQSPPSHGHLYARGIIHQGRAIGHLSHPPSDVAAKGRYNTAIDLRTGKFEQQVVAGRLPIGYTPLAAEDRVWHAGGKSLRMGRLDRAGFGDTPGVIGNTAETTGVAYVKGKIFFRQRVDASEPHYRLVCYDVTKQ